jgi:hypothetical protein
MGHHNHPSTQAFHETSPCPPLRTIRAVVAKLSINTQACLLFIRWPAMRIARLHRPATQPKEAVRTNQQALSKSGRRCAPQCTPKLFFILGCPRSGTTLLQQSLNRHTGIVIPPETKFFSEFLGHAKSCQLRHLARLNGDLQVDLSLPRNTPIGHCNARTFYESMATLYLSRQNKPDVRWFGEKTPEHTLHISQIRRIFPEAKLIVIYRDGRDVALSMTKVPWMVPDVYVCFVVWLYFYRAIVRLRRQCRSNVCWLQYEAFVSHPERELSRLCDFLGLPYEPSTALGWGNTSGVPSREYSWKADSFHRIHTDRVHAWKEELTAKEIAILERLGASPLRSLGYSLMSNGRQPLSFRFHFQLFLNLIVFAFRLPKHLLSPSFLGISLCFGHKTTRRSGQPTAGDRITVFRR